jgi:hypothetical protein
MIGKSILKTIGTTILITLLLLLSRLALPAEAAALWGIYWVSNPQPCKGILSGFAGPVISSYYKPCRINGVDVSICPGTSAPSPPWDANAAITIVGYEITMILSSATSQGVMEVGSGHRDPVDGADVFAMTGGVGTSSKVGFFPSGVGIPQGNSPGYAHFDIYAACDGGPSAQFQTIVNIYYTSP